MVEFRYERDVKMALQRALLDYARTTGRQHVYEPVENKLNLGTHDIFIGCGGQSAWVETKRTVSAVAKPKIRPGQPGFGSRMLQAGLNCVMLVGHPDGSCRLLKGDTIGDDWRDKLIGEYPAIDGDVVSEVFMKGHMSW